MIAFGRRSVALGGLAIRFLGGCVPRGRPSAPFSASVTPVSSARDAHRSMMTPANGGSAPPSG